MPYDHESLRVSALQSHDVGEAFQDLRHVCPASTKFLDASEVKLLSEKWPKSTVELGHISKFLLGFLTKHVFLAFPAIKTDSDIV